MRAASTGTACDLISGRADKEPHNRTIRGAQDALVSRNGTEKEKAHESTYFRQHDRCGCSELAAGRYGARATGPQGEKCRPGARPVRRRIELVRGDPAPADG